MKRMIGIVMEDVLLRAIVMAAGMYVYMLLLLLALTVARAVD
jgi:hypothetical protein